MKTTKVRLGKYCLLRNGFAFKSTAFSQNGVPLIRISDISDGNVSNSKSVKVPFDDIYDKFIVKEGDILIAMSGATTGKLGRYVSTNIAYQNQRVGCFVILDHTKLDKEYLYYLVLNLKPRIEKDAYGGGQPNISSKIIEDYPVNLPLLNDQKRIAKVLSKAEELIHKRKQTIALLDEYLKSVFLDMFGDPVRNTKEWRLEPLTKLGSLDRGVSKHRPRNAPHLLGGKYPLIQTGEVTNSGTYITSFSNTYSEAGLAQSKLWPEGTLLITIAANIAATAILTFEACFPDSVVGFIPDNDESNAIYVHFLFGFFQKILERNAPQAAQKNVNLAILRNLKVPKPSKPLQDKFAAIVVKADSIKQQYEQSLSKLEELYASLSQRAFKGELDVSRVEIEKDDTEEINAGAWIGGFEHPEDGIDAGVDREQTEDVFPLTGSDNIDIDKYAKALANRVLRPFRDEIGKEIIFNVFHNKEFRLKDLKEELDKAEVSYDYKQLKDLIFKLLDKEAAPRLIQYFSDEKWQQFRERRVNPAQDDYSGAEDGEIWFYYDKQGSYS